MRHPIILFACLALFGFPASAEKELLWGDTHLHTSYSTDAFLNQNFTVDPDAAYRFAKGLPVVHPSTGTRVQIESPLDFLVVADHAESFGVVKRAYEEGLPKTGLGPVDWLRAWVLDLVFRQMSGDPSSIAKIY